MDQVEKALLVVSGDPMSGQLAADPHVGSQDFCNHSDSADGNKCHAVHVLVPYTPACCSLHTGAAWYAVLHVSCMPAKHFRGA